MTDTPQLNNAAVGGSDRRCRWCGMVDCGTTGGHDHGSGFVDRSDKCKLYKAMACYVKAREEITALKATLENLRNIVTTSRAMSPSGPTQTGSKSGEGNGPRLVRTLIYLIRKLSRWAWKPELDTLAAIDGAQKNPPSGMIRMYCAGWRDKNMIGWGDYYLHSIHATPEAATAAIESLRSEHGWDERRSTSCGQSIDVFFPDNIMREQLAREVRSEGSVKTPEERTELEAGFRHRINGHSAPRP